MKIKIEKILRQNKEIINKLEQLKNWRQQNDDNFNSWWNRFR